MVARATLMWFDEPCDLHNTSWMPASSRMARTTGDHAGTGSSRLQQYTTSTHDPNDGMDNGRTGQRHTEQVALGLLGPLLDSQRDLLGLAVTEADSASTVADHHQGGEREPTTTLDDLGHAIDVNDSRLPQGGVVAHTRVALLVVVMCH